MLKLLKRKNEEEVQQTEEIKEESMLGKIAGWSLKKKLFVIGGVIGTGVAGALVLGSKSNKDGDYENCESEDEDYDDYDDEDYDNFDGEDDEDEDVTVEETENRE